MADDYYPHHRWIGAEDLCRVAGWSIAQLFPQLLGKLVRHNKSISLDVSAKRFRQIARITTRSYLPCPRVKLLKRNLVGLH